MTLNNGDNERLTRTLTELDDDENDDDNDDIVRTADESISE